MDDSIAFALALAACTFALFKLLNGSDPWPKASRSSRWSSRLAGWLAKKKPSEPSAP